MAESPSRKFDENGVLVERALGSDAAGEAEEAEAVTGREPDEAPENSTFAERAKARGKAVQSAENKAVSKTSKKTSKKASKK